jgi:formylglycine-generating enzyme required for sulfatase activity
MTGGSNFALPRLVADPPEPDRAPGAGGRKAAPTWARAQEIAGNRDMVWIEGGTFLMGSDRHYPEERPLRSVRAEGFWIDRAPVTNREFARFVAATGYTTFAERAPRAEDFPDAPAENLVAGSMVFLPSSRPIPLDQPHLWWAFVRGADWRHPNGPDSSLSGLEDHPVVHVALVDVEAYAAWAEVALPEEKEWEYAAKGGLETAEYAWGEALEPNGEPMANTWQGTFPFYNSGRDGWVRTSPVGFYPANGYGLFDMIGNVWEWTQDWWTAHPIDDPRKMFSPVQRRASAAPDDLLQIPRRVLKGGSHLCAPNHCSRYRPSARHAHPIDAGASDIGFRCVVRPPARPGGESDGDF